MKIKLYIIALASAALTACSSYSPVAEFSGIADELEQNSQTYTADDWAGIISQYESIIESMQGYEYSDEELQEIGHQQGRCLAYITKGYAILAAKKGAGYLNQLKGLVEGFEQEFGDGDEIVNSVESLIDGILGGNN